MPIEWVSVQTGARGLWGERLRETMLHYNHMIGVKMVGEMLPNESNRVTLADVARSAGVSQTAASFVLSGRREEMRISTAVEARVLKAVRETGYRPNIVSRSLRTGSSQTIWS